MDNIVSFPVLADVEISFIWDFIRKSNNFSAQDWVQNLHRCLKNFQWVKLW